MAAGNPLTPAKAGAQAESGPTRDAHTRTAAWFPASAGMSGAWGNFRDPNP